MQTALRLLVAAVILVAGVQASKMAAYGVQHIVCDVDQGHLDPLVRGYNNYNQYGYTLDWAAAKLDANFEKEYRRLDVINKTLHYQKNVVKLNTPGYPLSTIYNVKLLVALSPISVVVLGNLRAYHNFYPESPTCPFHGIYETPFITLVEMEPTAGLIRRTVDGQNNLPAIMTSGYYCRTMRNATVACPEGSPAGQVCVKELPDPCGELVHGPYYIPHDVGSIDAPLPAGTRPTIEEGMAFAASCDHKCEKKITKKVKSFLREYNGKSSPSEFAKLFDKDAEVCTIRSSVCDNGVVGAPKVRRNFVDDYGITGTFRPQEIYYINKNTAFFKGFFAKNRLNPDSGKNMSEILVGLVYVEFDKHGKVTFYQEGFDDAGTAYLGGYCASDDFRSGVEPDFAPTPRPF